MFWSKKKVIGTKTAVLNILQALHMISVTYCDANRCFNTNYSPIVRDIRYVKNSTI